MVSQQMIAQKQERAARLLRAATICFAALLLGCQSSTSKPTNGTQALPEFHGQSLDEALGSDECSTRMQDIEGVLAVYCANNQNRLPDSLDQLKEVPGLGPSVNLTCPATGKPYEYSQAGLFLANESRRIIVWEPSPSHQGSRLCLLVPRLERGSAVTMEVKLIPEVLFKKAVPAIQ